MIIKCIANTGKYLRAFESPRLSVDQTGKFGTSANSIYNQLEIGKEYLVMALIFWHQDVIQYSLYGGDNNPSTWVLSAPSPLFAIVDSKISRSWHFKQYEPKHRLYPSFTGVMGYEELVLNDNHFELLVDGNGEAEEIFYRRAIEMKREFRWK